MIYKSVNIIIKKRKKYYYTKYYKTQKFRLILYNYIKLQNIQ